jgi:colicin import membrane protein
METTADKFRAFGFALLVHAVCIFIAVIGVFWTRSAAPVSIPGIVIEAELVGPTQAPKSRTSKRPPAPKPPDPPPKPEETKPVVAEPPKPDTVDRERIAAIALQKTETQKREEQERKRAEQILLDQEKQLEEIKRQREAAEKKRKIEQAKLEQLVDKRTQDQKKIEQDHQAEIIEAEQKQTGQAGKDDSLLAQYSAAIQNAVTRSWSRPETAKAGLRCAIRVIQIPGGDVISASVVSPCNADELTRSSIEQAVTKAQPLPYKGYEKVFSREITFIFTYDGN